MLEIIGGSACTQHRCDGIAEFFPFWIEADFDHNIIDLKKIRISDGGNIFLHALRDGLCPVDLNVLNINQFRSLAGFNADVSKRIQIAFGIHQIITLSWKESFPFLEYVYIIPFFETGKVLRGLYKQEHMMLDRESMIGRLREAKNKTYYFYESTALDAMEDEKIENLCANMMNHLSDARTHKDW